MEYEVWTCKLVIPKGTIPPEINGFDSVPRQAAIQAVTLYTDVVACFSGWGGTLSETELAVVRRGSEST